MRFVHFADCHIDGYRDHSLASLGMINFRYVIDYAVTQQVDFVLLAGDLFNTALPRIDALKETITELKKLQQNNIPVYAIPGSHDYSPYGKTMLDVLELAGLIINVMKGTVDEQGRLVLEWTVDEKTQAHITGIIGKKGMLDKQYYASVTIKDSSKDSFKIFMFHTAIDELKGKDLDMMESSPVSILPQGFDYYAGGHVHITKQYESPTHQKVIYPGPTFPNSFSELEKLQSGTFVFFENNTATHIKIPGKHVVSISYDASEKSPDIVTTELSEKINSTNVKDSIILIRLQGILSDGKPHEIDFKNIFKTCYDQGAYTVLKNTNKLQGKMFTEITVEEGSTEKIEEQTIKEHLNQIPMKNELEKINKLLQLDLEPYDGEKKGIFQERIIELVQHVVEDENESSDTN